MYISQEQVSSFRAKPLLTLTQLMGLSARKLVGNEMTITNATKAAHWHAQHRTHPLLLVEVDQEGHLAGLRARAALAAGRLGALAVGRRQLLQPLAQHLLQVLRALRPDSAEPVTGRGGQPRGWQGTMQATSGLMTPS
jgi:hypothetical protein